MNPGRRRFRVRFVVEGPAEEAAMPRILERWLKRERVYDAVECVGSLATHNVDRLLEPHDPKRKLGIEYYVTRAIRDLAYPGAVVVVLDADKRCPKTVGPSLLARARAAAGGFHVSVVVANRELENWLLADLLAILTGERHPAATDGSAPVIADADEHAGADGVLKRVFGRYTKAIDAGRFAAHLTFDEAMLERSRSIRKLDKELREITRRAVELTNA